MRNPQSGKPRKPEAPAAVAKRTVQAARVTTFGVTHLGLTVPDLDLAMQWYASVLGWRMLMGPVELVVSDSHAGRQTADVFGPKFQEFRQAHMTTGNGISIELFQFVEPSTALKHRGFRYWEPGVSHICLLTSDVRAMAARIEAAGGAVRTSVWEVFEGEPYETCFCEDPFGNVLELYSHPHEQVFGSRSAY